MSVPFVSTVSPEAAAALAVALGYGNGSETEVGEGVGGGGEGCEVGAAAAADGGMLAVERGPCPPLPVECEADKHPVVVLWNVYTKEESEADPNFFDDLEADMLMECVKFGTVMRVVTPDTPEFLGSVCVTFDGSVGARECSRAMHGRWFDQRQIEAEVTGKVDPEPREETPAQGCAPKDELTSFLDSI
ncbi:unnamed protein product [Choristocarpus tenellus]